MEGFTIIDGVAAAVIVISAILAYSRGFVRECLSIAGWVIAAIVAFIFAPRAVPLAKEIPYINTLIEGCEPATITAFALVFAVVLVIVSIFTPIFSGAVQRSVLGGLDQGLGFLFGVARGLLLVIVAIVIYDRVVADNSIPMIDDSRTARVVGEMSGPIDNVVPSDAPGWIVGTYEKLIADCLADGTDTDATLPTTDG
jgi:membrane protein required for colicin V production